MKIKQAQLKQIIKEELERELSNEPVEEGWLDAAKSLAGQAGSAVANKAKQVGQAVSGAVTTARQASAKADIAPLAQKAMASVEASANVISGLVTRMERLGMEEVRQLDAVTDALKAAKTSLSKLIPPPPVAKTQQNVQQAKKPVPSRTKLKP